MKTAREFTAQELRMLADLLDAPMANTVASCDQDGVQLRLWAHFDELAELAADLEAVTMIRTTCTECQSHDTAPHAEPRCWNCGSADVTAS